MSDLSATPLTPSYNNLNYLVSGSDVKSATPEIILFDEEIVNIDNLEDLIFEDIGGHELISIARTDTVNGQSLYYNPIRNLSEIQRQYNSKNILSLQQTSDKYFENFSIKLDLSLPSVGNGPNGSNIYIDSKTGDIVVESIGLQPDEQIEIQIALDGTIYEAQIW